MSEQDVFEALKYRIEVNRFGTRWYYNNAGQIHRDNGPAIECSDGSKSWCQNGLLHRTDGPAVELDDGHKEWWQNGKRHRIDGPAVEYADDSKEWHINGVVLTEAEFNQEVKQNV